MLSPKPGGGRTAGGTSGAVPGGGDAAAASTFHLGNEIIDGCERLELQAAEVGELEEDVLAKEQMVENLPYPLLASAATRCLCQIWHFQ